MKRMYERRGDLSKFKLKTENFKQSVVAAHTALQRAQGRAARLLPVQDGPAERRLPVQRRRKRRGLAAGAPQHRGLGLCRARALGAGVALGPHRHSRACGEEGVEAREVRGRPHERRPDASVQFRPSLQRDGPAGVQVHRHNKNERPAGPAAGQHQGEEIADRDAREGLLRVHHQSRQGRVPELRADRPHVADARDGLRHPGPPVPQPHHRPPRLRAHRPVPTLLPQLHKHPGHH